MLRKSLIIATRNKDKTQEIKSLFKQAQNFTSTKLSTLDVVDLSDSVPTTPTTKITWIENGGSFEINAEIKARAVRKKFPNSFIISDDSGLCVPALNGLPGVESANYAGEQATYEANNLKLLQALRDIPTGARSAYYVCVICLLDLSGEAYFFKNICTGQILTTNPKKSGFGYDPLFYSNDLEKPFYMASLEEKNRVSHRSKAISQFISFFSASFL